MIKWAMGKSQDLLNAARAGDKWTVEKIIGILTKRSGPFTNFSLRKCGLNVQDDTGYTPLHHACLNGHTDVVRLLLSAGASPSVVDKTGASPLHLAAWKGDSAIVTMLLAHNPPVNIDLMTANQETPLIMAAQYGSVNVVAQLVDRGADVTLRNIKDESALDLAAQYGRLPTVKHLLATHPTLVHQYKYPNWRVHKFNSTPLHRAAKNGHAEVVQLLLAAGIDPNIRTNSGTPLHEAACFGKSSVVRVLLEAGADLNEVDGRGKTVEELLADYSEEATRRVRRAIREFKNSSRHKYDDEEEPRPYSIPECSPTSYPHIPGLYPDSDLPLEKQSNAAYDALTNPDINDVKRVSNANNKTTEDLVRQSLQTNNPNHITYNNKIQSQSYNLELRKHSNSHDYINLFLNLWRGKPSSNTVEQTVIYENIVEESSHSISQPKKTKKPKPPPKPKIPKNEWPNPNETIYANAPDDIKLMHEHIYESMGGKHRFYDGKYARKSFSEIYTSMDGSTNKISAAYTLKADKRRLSVSSGSIYVDMNPKFKNSESSRRSGCHFRGSIGCIHENTSEYYSIYDLKPEALRNNEYPFERTKQKFDRLPCFCHHKCNDEIAREIFYSCENFSQAEVANGSDDNIPKELNEQTDLNAMIFEPFEEDTLPSNQTEKSEKVKNIFVKKIRQLTQLLVDWDTEK